MRRDEHEAIPARWLMVPAGVEIDLDPPCAATCHHCRPHPPARQDAAPGPTAAPDAAAPSGHTTGAGEWSSPYRAARS
ncbi:hypothetical protein ABZT03_18905 [Streptomyces sp. NPDC005574]|uniref:hypothetical protein n=1 Tax=Streptomyces sp. NPDC005574 TaxID=3156891 RepID=UPI0033BBDCCA